MIKRFLAIATLAGLLFGAASCDSTSNTQGVYMLLDTSGTYNNELAKAQQIILAILTRLEPGDSFAVARIDTGSFSEKDIVASMTLDDRPSVASQQKREFQAQIAAFVKSSKASQYTDVTGGIMQASEFLKEKGAGHQTIVIYSDLKEELEKGFKRQNLEFDIDGFNVVALNVTKLRSDNVDPQEYLDRLEYWRKRVAKGGGEFRVINNLDNLEELLP